MPNAPLHSFESFKFMRMHLINRNLLSQNQTNSLILFCCFPVKELNKFFTTDPLLYSKQLRHFFISGQTLWRLDFKWSGCQRVWLSKGQAITLAISVVPTIWKPDCSKSGCFSGSQMFLIKWQGICPVFKWLGFQISGFKIRTIWNQSLFDHFSDLHLQLFYTKFSLDSL